MSSTEKNVAMKELTSRDVWRARQRAMRFYGPFSRLLDDSVLARELNRLLLRKKR